jgi:probable nitrogen fixation protein
VAVLRDDASTEALGTDADLLAPFLVNKEQRRAIPIIGDPDPEIMQRVAQFYRAIARSIAERCGISASPVMKLSHEGFGRSVITVGRLVVLARTLRDVHRFGFDGLDALAREGEKGIAMALAAIKQFPEVARA